ncbi:MAG: ADP-ribosyltransferase [Acidaminobacteraceae bacterium]
MFSRNKFNEIVDETLENLCKLDLNLHKYKRHYTYEESKKWGEKNFGIWSKKLANEKISQEVFDSMKEFDYNQVAMYCGWSYRDVNEKLRSQGKFQNEEYVNKIIVSLDKVFETQSLPENILLIRWISSDFLDRNIFGRISVCNGKELVDYAYKSCSALLTHKVSIHGGERDTSKETLLVIKANANAVSKGVYLDQISKRGNEQEILLDRKTKIIVEKTLFRNKSNSIILCYLE